MVYDAFKTHKTDNVKELLAINDNLALGPVACKSKYQPLDVCINKPFEGVLRNFWEDCVANIFANVRFLSFHRHRDKILLTWLLKTLITWKITPMSLKIHFVFVKSQKMTG